ncbi:hypothetical protein GCM10023167_25870 [Brevibacterium pityocampae]|uniref:HNH endonuclease n=2 Tax=Brevibacteriaceae TaxID=85019 RepID=A0ABP8JSR3_9MICO
MGKGRRGRFTIEGQEFTGWIPAKELTTHEQEKIERLEDAMNDRPLGFEVHQSMERQRKEIEGDLIPTCECGRKGLPDDWISPSFRNHRTGQQHISHRHKAEMDRIVGHQSARMAAAALDHAADAWDGDKAVAQWLRDRAEHIVEVDYYDGEEWPEQAQADA